MHTGDFKIDYTPVFGDAIDLGRFAELGKKGVLALMCESTNVERDGIYAIREDRWTNSRHLFDENKDHRIIVATFASNVGSVYSRLLTVRIVVERRLLSREEVWSAQSLLQQSSAYIKNFQITH